MPPSGRHRHKQSLKTEQVQENPLTVLARSFWEPPRESCPKCNSTQVEYYDPFFFSPIRTIKGRRRIRCNACSFIWRPSRKGRTLLELLGLKR
jgi:hypothetical protein